MAAQLTSNDDDLPIASKNGTDQITVTNEDDQRNEAASTTQSQPSDGTSSSKPP